MAEGAVDILVISFGTSISNPQLDALGPPDGDAKWELLSVSPDARERLLAAIRQSLKSMTDEHGKIMQDPQIWQEALDGGDNLDAT